MANEKPRAFILQWRAAVLNSNLPSSAKLSLIVLAEFANQDGSNCFPSIETIARVSSCNERTTRRVLETCRKAGWIRSQSKGNRSGWRHYEYTLLLPDGADNMPARSYSPADTTPARLKETCGQIGQNVRTSATEGADTVSTYLSNTYPIPIKNQASKTADAVPVPSFWEIGKDYLVKKGVDIQKAGAVIGKLRKQVGEAETLKLLMLAQREDISDPVTWLYACANKSSMTAKVLPRDDRSDDELAEANNAAALRLAGGYR